MDDPNAGAHDHLHHADREYIRGLESDVSRLRGQVAALECTRLELDEKNKLLQESLRSAEADGIEADTELAATAKSRDMMQASLAKLHTSHEALGMEHDRLTRDWHHMVADYKRILKQNCALRRLLKVVL